MSQPSPFVVAPAETHAVSVLGSDARFPVRRIYCVGRNYLDHIAELGNDSKEPPVFFIKPADTIVEDGGEVPYPSGTNNLHFEVEFVIAIGTSGYRIAEADALQHVFGYAVGLDMTKRDVQRALGAKGKPWELGKVFDHGMPCGPITPAAQSGHLSRGRIHMEVNGTTQQDADLASMIWNVPGIIVSLSQHYRLYPGDLIYTGTPAGVGPVVVGDVMVGAVDGLAPIRATIAAPEL